MMATPNRPRSLPRFDAAKGKLFRRAPFLDGTHKAYYMPGQGYAADRTAYQNPTDWPKAGSLLRVPQMVWISFALPSAWYFAPLGDSTGAGPYYGAPDWGGWNVRRAAGAPEGGGGKVRWLELREDDFPIDDDFVLTTNYPAKMATLLAGWRDLADAVKGRVEAKRPGRTWVQVCPWHLPSGGNANAWQENFLPLQAPADGAYFGVDFLHVYIGHVAVDYTDEDIDGGTPGDARVFDLAADVSPSPLTLPAYAAARARLVAARKKFAGHATWLYGYDGPTDEDWEFAILGFDTGDPSDFHETHDEIWAQMKRDDSSIQYFLDIGPNNSTLMGRIAGGLADDGVSFKGSATGLDATALTAAIADYFGFDPDTGRDRPPG